MLFFMVSAIISFTKLETLPFSQLGGNKISWLILSYGFTLLMALGFLGLAIHGHFYQGEAVNLTLPFDKGRF